MRRCGRIALLVLLFSGVVAEDSPAQTDPSDHAGGDMPKDANAADAPAAAVVRPARPLGMLSRPKDSVRHVELDRAWSEHDAVVTRVTERIKDAIDQQFDAATDKADLDAAAKWEVVLKRFEEHGDLPNEKETEAAVNEAIVEYWDAKAALAEAYDAVIKDLTRQQQIATAKSVREELRMQQSRNCDPVRLRDLHKELEAISDRGGWNWQRGNGPTVGMYSVDKESRELTHRDPQGIKLSQWCLKYEVIGFDDDNENIALIQMTYPPEQGKPGVQQVWRFNRKTGFMGTGYGWLAVPSRQSK